MVKFYGALINNILVIPTIEIASLVALYIYFGHIATLQFVFIGLDLEVSLAFHNQYKQIVANEKVDIEVRTTDTEEDVAESEYAAKESYMQSNLLQTLTDLALNCLLVLVIAFIQF